MLESPPPPQATRATIATKEIVKTVALVCLMITLSISKTLMTLKDDCKMRNLVDDQRK